MHDDDALQLEGAELIDWDAVGELDAKVSRHWRKQWDAIIMFMEMLMHGAPADRFEMICKDGAAVTVAFDKDAEKDRRPIETLTVICQDPEEAQSLRKLWPDVAAADSTFPNVPAEDVIELAWNHGGINMAASRNATHGKEIN